MINCYENCESNSWSAAYMFDCAALGRVSSLSNQKKEEAKADVLGEKIKNNKGNLYIYKAKRCSYNVTLCILKHVSL